MVLVSFGVSVCLSLSVVPLGEQQSLSEDGGNGGGVEGAPQDLEALVRRVLWGAHGHLGRGECAPKAEGEQGHPGG